MRQKTKEKEKGKRKSPTAAGSTTLLYHNHVIIVSFMYDTKWGYGTYFRLKQKCTKPPFSWLLVEETGESL